MIGEFIQQGNVAGRGLKTTLPTIREHKNASDDDSAQMQAMLQTMQMLGKKKQAQSGGWYHAILDPVGAFVGSAVHTFATAPFELAKILTPKAWEEPIAKTERMFEASLGMGGAMAAAAAGASPEFAKAQERAREQIQQENPISSTLGSVAGTVPYMYLGALGTTGAVASVASKVPAVADAVSVIPQVLNKASWLTKMTGTFAPAGSTALEMGSTVLGTAAGGGIATGLGEAEAYNKGLITGPEYAAHSLTGTAFGGLMAGVHKGGRIANALWDAATNATQSVATQGESALLNPESMKDKSIFQQAGQDAVVGFTLGLIAHRSAKLGKQIDENVTKKVVDQATKDATAQAGVGAGEGQVAPPPSATQAAGVAEAVKASMPSLVFPEGRMRQATMNYTPEQWASLYEHSTGTKPVEGMAIVDMAKEINKQFMSHMSIPHSLKTGKDLAYDYVSLNAGDNKTAGEMWKTYSRKAEAINEATSYVQIAQQFLSADVARIADGLSQGRIAPSVAIEWARDLQARAKKAGIKYDSQVLAMPADGATVAGISTALAADAKAFTTALSKALTSPKVGRGIETIDGTLGFNIVGEKVAEPAADVISFTDKQKISASSTLEGATMNAVHAIPELNKFVREELQLDPDKVSIEQIKKTNLAWQKAVAEFDDLAGEHIPKEWLPSNRSEASPPVTEAQPAEAPNGSVSEAGESARSQESANVPQQEEAPNGATPPVMEQADTQGLPPEKPVSIAEPAPTAERPAQAEQLSLFEPIKGEPNATQERVVTEDRQPEHSGTTQGEGVPENQGEVRQGESQQASDSNSPVESGQVQRPLKIWEEPEIQNDGAGRLARYVDENVDDLDKSAEELAKSGGFLSRTRDQIRKTDKMISAYAYSIGFDPSSSSTFINLDSIRRKTLSALKKRELVNGSFKATLEEETAGGRVWETPTFTAAYDEATGMYQFRTRPEVAEKLAKAAPEKIFEPPESTDAQKSYEVVKGSEDAEQKGSVLTGEQLDKSLDNAKQEAAVPQRKRGAEKTKKLLAKRNAIADSITNDFQRAYKIPVDEIEEGAEGSKQWIENTLQSVWDDPSNPKVQRDYLKIQKSVSEDALNTYNDILLAERQGLLFAEEVALDPSVINEELKSTSITEGDTPDIENITTSGKKSKKAADGGAHSRVRKSLGGATGAMLVAGITSQDLKALGLDEQDEGSSSPDGPDVPARAIIAAVATGLLAVWAYKKKGFVIKRALGIGKEALPAGHPLNGLLENSRAGYMKSGSHEQYMHWDAQLRRKGLEPDSPEYKKQIEDLRKEDKELSLGVPSATAAMQFMAKNPHPIAQSVRDRVTECQLEVKTRLSENENMFNAFLKATPQDMQTKLAKLMFDLDYAHTEIGLQYPKDAAMRIKVSEAYDQKTLHDATTGIAGTDPELYKTWRMAEELFTKAREAMVDGVTYQRIGVWKDLDAYKADVEEKIEAIREMNKSLTDRIIDLSSDNTNNEEIERLTGIVNANRTTLRIKAAQHQAIVQGELLKSRNVNSHYLPRWVAERDPTSKAVRIKKSESDPGWLLPYDTEEELHGILAQYPAEDYPIIRMQTYGEPELHLKSDKINQSRLEIDAINTMLNTVVNEADARGYIPKSTAMEIIKQLGVEDLSDPKSQTYLIARKEMQEFVRKATTGNVMANDVRQLLTTIAVRRPPQHLMARKNVRGYMPEEGSLGYEAGMRSLLAKTFDYMNNYYESAVNRVGIIEANNNAISYMAERGVGNNMRKVLQDINTGFSTKEMKYGASVEGLMGKVNKADREYFRPFLLFKTIALSPGLGFKNMYNGFKTNSIEMTWRAGGNPFKAAWAGARALTISPLDALSPYKYLESVTNGNKTLRDLHQWYMNHNVYDATFRNSVTEALPENWRYGAMGKFQDGAYYFMKVTERFNRQQSALTAARLFLDEHPGDFEGAKFAGIQGAENAQGLYKNFTQTEAERWLRRQPLGNTFYTLMSAAARASELTAATMAALATKPGLRKQAAGSLIAYLGSSLVFGGILTGAITGDVYTAFKGAFGLLNGTGDEAGSLKEDFDEKVERLAGEMFEKATGGKDPEMGRMFFRYVRNGVLTNITGKNFSNDQTILGILAPAAFAVGDDAYHFATALSKMHDDEALVAFARLVNTTTGRAAIGAKEFRTGYYLDRKFNPLREGYGGMQYAAEVLAGRDMVDTEEYNKFKFGGGMIYTESDAANFMKKLESAGLDIKKNLPAVALLSKPGQAEAFREKTIRAYHDKAQEMDEALGFINGLTDTHEGRLFLRQMATHGLEEAGSSQEQEQLQSHLANVVRNYYASEAAQEVFAHNGIGVKYKKTHLASPLESVARYLVGKAKSATKEEKNYAPMYQEEEEYADE